ncbi:MAG: hypothetical protein LUE29_09990 [Lachnospiraceae bacterium]|nr:hypothetical protein [Lachnospiraceae bacterium]
MSIHEKRVRSLRYVWRMFVYTFNILLILGAVGLAVWLSNLCDAEKLTLLVRQISEDAVVVFFMDDILIWIRLAITICLGLAAGILWSMSRFIGYDMEYRLTDEKLLDSLGYRVRDIARYEGVYFLADFFTAWLLASALLLLICCGMKDNHTVKIFLNVMGITYFLRVWQVLAVGLVIFACAWISVRLRVGKRFGKQAGKRSEMTQRQAENQPEPKHGKFENQHEPEHGRKDAMLLQPDGLKGENAGRNIGPHTAGPDANVFSGKSEKRKIPIHLKKRARILAAVGGILLLLILFFTVGHGACRILAWINDLSSGSMIAWDISEDNAIGKQIRKIKYHDWLEIWDSWDQELYNQYVGISGIAYITQASDPDLLQYNGQTYQKNCYVSGNTELGEFLMESDSVGDEGVYAVPGISTDYMIAEKKTGSFIYIYINGAFGQDLTFAEYLDGLGIADLCVDLFTANQSMEVYYVGLPAEYMDEHLTPSATAVAEDDEIMEGASRTGLRIIWKNELGMPGQIWFWDNGCVSIRDGTAKYASFDIYYDLEDEDLSIGKELIRYARKNLEMMGQ